MINIKFKLQKDTSRVIDSGFYVNEISSPGPDNLPEVTVKRTQRTYNLISNTENILITDVVDKDGNSYFYKVSANKQKTVERVTNNQLEILDFYSSDFLYVNKQGMLCVEYTDGSYEILRSFRVYENSSSESGVLQESIFQDGKTYTITIVGRKISIKIKTSKDLLIKTNTSKIGYNYVDGDTIEVLSMIDNGLYIPRNLIKIRDVRIISFMDSRYITHKTVDILLDKNAKHSYLIEISKPKVSIMINEPTIENKRFYTGGSMSGMYYIASDGKLDKRIVPYSRISKNTYICDIANLNVSKIVVTDSKGNQLNHKEFGGFLYIKSENNIVVKYDNNT